jgi:DNA polymerase III delta subunit
MSTVAEIRKQIKSGKTAPLYLLGGDDLQSRHDLAIEFANVVDEDLQAFNVQTFYANEATNAGTREQLIGSLIATARTLPMMSPRRVIIVHEADRLLSPKRGKDEDPAAEPEPPKKGKRAAASTPAEELEAYIEHPEPMTTLVFVAGLLDANRRVVKLLRKHAEIVDCGSLESPREAAMWITRRLEMDELAIEPKALALLLGATGLSLGRIRAEVDKLVLYAAGEATITATHVRDLVIPQNEPSEVFALMDAIKKSDASAALREVATRIDAGVPPPMLLGMIRAATIQLRPDARVKSGLEAVFRADLAIKSSAGAPQYLLECLVVELCARG